MEEFTSVTICLRAASRGFFYVAEAAFILSVKHGVEVKVGIVNWATKRGDITFRRSWPSRVKEIDIESFYKYRDTFRPRLNRRKVS